MDDLIAFWRARLDDAELAARNAGGERWDFTGINCEVRVREPSGGLGRIIAYCRHGSPVAEDLALTIHIGHNDPYRALRQVEADRELLARYREAAIHLAGNAATMPDSQLQAALAAQGAQLAVIRDRAAVWDDHPDYLDKWKP